MRVNELFHFSDRGIKVEIRNNSFQLSIAISDNGLDGEKLKVPPRGYSKEHPHIELLKMKSFLADLSFSDKDVISEEFFEVVVSAFRTMKPLNDFLTTGIG